MGRGTLRDPRQSVRLSGGGGGGVEGLLVAPGTPVVPTSWLSGASLPKALPLRLGTKPPCRPLFMTPWDKQVDGPATVALSSSRRISPQHP